MLSINRGFIGDQLVNMGIITSEQLSKALELQQKYRHEKKDAKLGTILTELGYCTDEDIAAALSKKSGYERVSLNNSQFDASVAKLIPPQVARKYNVLPLKIDADGLLEVAMLNPNDFIAIDDIQLLTGYKIKPKIVPDYEFKAVMQQYSSLNNMPVEIIDEDEMQEQPTDADSEINEKPAVQLANQIINNAIRSGASDIHIEPQEKTMRVRYRIDGVLHEVMTQPLKMCAPLVSRIKIMGGMDIAERRIPQDGRATTRLDDKIVDLRIASLPSAYGEKLTLRLINRNSRLITLKDMNLRPFHFERFYKTIHKPYGFILVTGPTGSGKSTTLYAALGEINKVDKNIITLEDPVERRIDGLNQIQMNTKAGMTFASSLRSVLRSDPDIIMVGEIRDAETAKIAVEAALTGHLVLSTLHTNDAAGAVTRLEEMGVETYLTASSLIGVIAQRLARVLCPRCKEKYTISADELIKVLPGFPNDENKSELELYRAKGCVACNHTGYKGRMGIYEFLPVSPAIQKLIVNHGSTRDIQEQAIAEGMNTMA
ncbi:MAG TPA: type II secretion system protein GspE, partial [Ruminococcaceae bacterium]|nr:type II secretion system protein GspE [Oscillospiraceae bacterium]